MPGRKKRRTPSASLGKSPSAPVDSSPNQDDTNASSRRLQTSPDLNTSTMASGISQDIRDEARDTKESLQSPSSPILPQRIPMDTLRAQGFIDCSPDLQHWTFPSQLFTRSRLEGGPGHFHLSPMLHGVHPSQFFMFGNQADMDSKQRFVSNIYTINKYINQSFCIEKLSFIW